MLSLLSQSGTYAPPKIPLAVPPIMKITGWGAENEIGETAAAPEEDRATEF